MEQTESGSTYTTTTGYLIEANVYVAAGAVLLYAWSGQLLPSVLLSLGSGIGAVLARVVEVDFHRLAAARVGECAHVDAGLAAVATGFAIDNNILIIVGALDGLSGFILSLAMIKAMNRSFANVLFGAFGSAEAGGVATAAAGGSRRGAQRVRPGIGLAARGSGGCARGARPIAFSSKKSVERFLAHTCSGRIPKSSSLFFRLRSARKSRLQRERVHFSDIPPHRPTSLKCWTPWRRHKNAEDDRAIVPQRVNCGSVT